MKQLIMISLFILINARILQQLYFRTNIERTTEVTNSEKTSKITSAYNTLCKHDLILQEVVTSYNDTNTPSIGKSINFNTGSHQGITDKRFTKEKGLMGKSKAVVCRVLSSIDVWKGVFSKISEFRHLLRDRISSAFNSVFDSNISEVVIGLLLGKEGLVRGSSYHLFKVTGTQHLMAISGFHMSLIIMFISKLYKNILPKNAYICINMLVSGLFLCLVGFSPGLFRAFLMFFISSSSIYFNRQKQSLISVFIAFIVSILLDIQVLTSISFQLSYSATLGIILLSRVFGRINLAAGSFLDGLPRVVGGVSSYFVDSFFISIIAQISVLPLVAYHFQQVNLFSIITSSLISWMIPLIMQMGIILIFSHFVLPFNWFFIFSIPLFFFVTTMIGILKLVSFEWFIVQFPSLTIWSIILSYLVIIAIYSIITFIKRIKGKQNHEKTYNFNF